MGRGLKGPSTQKTMKPRVEVQVGVAETPSQGKESPIIMGGQRSTRHPLQKRHDSTAPTTTTTTTTTTQDTVKWCA